MRVTTQDLIAALPVSRLDPFDPAVFSSPSKPEVFVHPVLETDEAEEPFAAEVILVSAPAAVGKSTVAHAIAAATRNPVLDLAKVPVGAGSLRGLIGGHLRADLGAVDAFLRGDFTIMIDALDEGRVRSGKEGFEHFIFDAWELLDQAERTPVPRLVLFGRPASVDDVETTLLLHNETKRDSNPISYRRLQLAFFDEDGATELVKQYAKATADDPDRIESAWTAIVAAVSAYYRSISYALGFDSTEDLWQQDLGRAFAGYAPVLAALGSSIARAKDYQSLATRLSREHKRAWAPIEEVISLVLDREAVRFRGALEPLLTSTDTYPDGAYGPSEQLRYLREHVTGRRSLAVSVPTSLQGTDADTYQRAVNQRIPEHPFVKQGQFANPVFAGYVLANGISSGDASGILRPDVLREHARAPFLWRSFNHQMDPDGELIDGVHLGYLLASRWNDPTEASPGVRLTGRRSGELLVELPNDVRITVLPPVSFADSIRDLVVDLGDSSDAEFRLEGEAMQISGPTVINVPVLKVEARKVFLDGSVWLEAREFASPTNLYLSVGDDAEVGWNQTIAEHYPWSHKETRLRHNPLAEPPPENKLYAIFAQAVAHSAGSVLVVYKQNLESADDPRWNWVKRGYLELFTLFVRLLLDWDLAEARAMSASGAPKLKISFKFRWSEMNQVARGEVSNPRLKAVIDEALSRFPQRLLHGS